MSQVPKEDHHQTLEAVRRRVEQEKLEEQQLREAEMASWEEEEVRQAQEIIIIIIIIITRPKPPFGRQGLAGSWGKDKVRRVNFGVFSTSHFAHSALSSD